MIRIQVLAMFLLINSISFSQEIKITKKNIHDLSNDYYSVRYLDKAWNMIKETQYLTQVWVKIDKTSKTPDKLRLKEIQTDLIPGIFSNLDMLAMTWNAYEQNLLSEIKSMADTLFLKQKYIMDQLSDFGSYDDPFVVFEVTPLIEYGGDVSQLNLMLLNKIGILETDFSQKLGKYLLPLIGDNNESAIDTKLLAAKVFIAKYGLNDIVNDQDKIDLIYNYYSKNELEDAVNDSIPKDSRFYKKYNELLIELLKK